MRCNVGEWEYAICAGFVAEMKQSTADVATVALATQPILRKLTIVLNCLHCYAEAHTHNVSIWPCVYALRSASACVHPTSKTNIRIKLLQRNNWHAVAHRRTCSDQNKSVYINEQECYVETNLMYFVYTDVVYTIFQVIITKCHLRFRLSITNEVICFTDIEACFCVLVNNIRCILCARHAQVTTHTFQRP